ncbi:regulatory subunit of 26S proteasome [Chloropicon primus]|uniref:26S proteasome non-ATPase regulatory subunit 1 homolog n=2 Tax=Chloropicon primus TaxID=1764295 RepID=A0A5B8MI63_9CHLO|nr:regulatory subunit of 26S proteasome [Chloropicon primus]UPQ99355.1 regulatory subunit of 26S proteasome [Chloropicon primus]|eukprot:QDZ20143.1 regulatory subunit of 26S proteasome [Chloropicon primus]
MASAAVVKRANGGMKKGEEVEGQQKLTSAQGLIALLDEDDDRLRACALKQLDEVVPDLWFEVSSSIATIEALYEDESFGERNLAALLASKVFYHLGELQESLTYALCAGSLFDVTEQSDYVQTIVGKCIDEYMKQREKGEISGEEIQIDSRLEAIVQRMFKRCLEDGQLEQAIGIALDSCHLDLLRTVAEHGQFDKKLLTYALRVCQNLIVSRKFREKALRLMVDLFKQLDQPDWIVISQCLMFLDEAAAVAEILTNLLGQDSDSILLAYQIAFDLFENEQPQFLSKVSDHVEKMLKKAEQPAETAADGEKPAASQEGAEPMEADQEMTGAAEGAAPAEKKEKPSSEEKESDRKVNKLLSILQGDAPIKLHLEFLYSKNRTDPTILKNLKSSVETRNSVCHSAIIFTNALMHMGTTVDTFLREHLDWLARATNWAKFSATAGLGVIHRGQLSQGQFLMAPYLPSDGSSGSPFSEGGALYALGLMHCDKGKVIRDFLLQSLRNASSEVVQHGACLGLGLATLGTDDEEVFEDLKNVLYTDSAVAGEAAGIAIGLLSVGTGSDKTEQMLAYAHDTQHEKITRGLALGCALVMYGREENADALILQLCQDQNPILRYGGMFCIGLAYSGTMSNFAIQKLLHFAVSDVSDDVRRAAVMCLGFVMYSQPEQCPHTVALLSESFNPHVRYGVAMALGIACAGTGMKEAMNILQVLSKDAIDFVRQGALIATSMVLLQQPESKVSGFRKKLDKIVSDKHEDVMCKMGAIIAVGLIDAGGRNVNIRLRSRNGFPRLLSVIGMAVFTQYWYWYPLSYFMSLPLTPTAFIGLNENLDMPKFSVVSKCKPSIFAYAEPVEHANNVLTSKAPTAVLSTTAKAKARAAKKEDAKKSTSEKGKENADSNKMEVEGEAAELEAAGDEKKEEGSKPKAEATEEQKENPTRVVPAQEKHVHFLAGSRFTPINENAKSIGIVLLKDNEPGKELEVVNIPVNTEPPASTEPPPPEPFEYNSALD